MLFIEVVVDDRCVIIFKERICFLGKEKEYLKNFLVNFGIENVGKE